VGLRPFHRCAVIVKSTPHSTQWPRGKRSVGGGCVFTKAGESTFLRVSAVFRRGSAILDCPNGKRCAPRLRRWWFHTEAAWQPREVDRAHYTALLNAARPGWRPRVDPKPNSREFAVDGVGKRRMETRKKQLAALPKGDAYSWDIKLDPRHWWRGLRCVAKGPAGSQ